MWPMLVADWRIWIQPGPDGALRPQWCRAIQDRRLAAAGAADSSADQTGASRPAFVLDVVDESFVAALVLSGQTTWRRHQWVCGMASSHPATIRDCSTTV